MGEAAPLRRPFVSLDLELPKIERITIDHSIGKSTQVLPGSHGYI
jgi:hypothetical protein